jgi:phosphopantetheinyl transferase
VPHDRHPLGLPGLSSGLRALSAGGPRVEVCLCHLSPDERDASPQASPLSAEERRVAARFVFAEHRRRFIQRHTALRELLGRYCGMAPSEIDLAHGSHGRPWVSNACGAVDFSLSHSGDWAAVAVSKDGWVGIDLERSDGPGWQDLIPTTMTAAEQHQLAATPAALRASRFFAHWTAKEAFMKLNGLGLGLAPASIEVVPGAEADRGCDIAVAVNYPAGLAIARASLTRIEAPAELSCTLATALPPRALTLTRWPPQPSLRVSLPSACASLR